MSQSLKSAQYDSDTTDTGPRTQGCTRDGQKILKNQLWIPYP